MAKPTEALFWSIALPGFGQLLNGKVIKGIVFILMETVINIQAHFNQVILFSFQGKIDKAVVQADYQWLMFYPCLYFFAMWDAFKDAGGGRRGFSYLPFVFSAYFVTVGIMFSTKMTIHGVLLGPMWLPMLFTLPGLACGFLLKAMLNKRND